VDVIADSDDPLYLRSAQRAFVQRRSTFDHLLLVSGADHAEISIWIGQNKAVAIGGREGFFARRLRMKSSGVFLKQ
jgi:bifunctional DNase/RNase